MPIINSSYVVDQVPQADGRRWVKETHTDHFGKQFFAEYLAADDFDYQACLTQRAANISVEIDRQYAIASEAATITVNFRKIRQDAFFDRFSVQEAIRIHVSTDNMIRYFEKSAVTLKRPYINLDHPMIRTAMAYLRDHEILDGATLAARQARMDAMLADGTIGEI